MQPLSFSSLSVVLSLGLVSVASVAPIPRAPSDPCANIAGQDFVVPADALACLKSFPFNETLRQNVLTVVSRVFDFFTFEEFYLDSPPPFQESTANIRQELARINNADYAVCLLFRPPTPAPNVLLITACRRTLTSIRTCLTSRRSSTTATPVNGYSQ